MMHAGSVPQAVCATIMLAGQTIPCGRPENTPANSGAGSQVCGFYGCMQNHSITRLHG
jgi:hypothetical protein